MGLTGEEPVAQRRRRSGMPEATAEVESLVELLGAVADALGPGAMVTAHPHADPSRLLAR
jgi:hypothetical protein